MNRYSRDELISIALALVDSSTLMDHDMKGGTVSPNAYSIKWLNEALDSFHLRYPFAADIDAVALTIQPSLNYMILTASPTEFLPQNFMLDVRDGVILQQSDGFSRLRRSNFQRWLDVYNSSFNQPQAFPSTYAIWQNKLQVAPTPTQSFSAVLWYYARPPLLTADQKPVFPDEYVLIDFIRLKALEHLKQVQPGTARAYMQKEMGRLKQLGLLHDTEEESIPISQTFIADGSVVNRNAWMQVASTVM